MSRIVEVITPEQVTIRYELAGFGSRALAAGVDLLLSALFMLLVAIPIFIANFGTFDFNDLSWQAISRSFLIGILILIIFIITWGYFIFFETLWNGTTPGKRIFGLQVIRDGGFPVDFRAVLIRNLVRAVDMMPTFYALGFVSVIWNEQYKRLGDIAAGTIVVRHGLDDDDFPEFSYGSTVVLRLFKTQHLAKLSRVTREEQRRVEQYLGRRTALPAALRSEFARRLALPLMARLDYQPPQSGLDYERWLDELLLACRTRLQGEAPVQTMAASYSPDDTAASAPGTISLEITQPELAATTSEGRRW